MGESSWALRRAPELPDADFERWRQLLETRAGMVLEDRQRSFLQIQLAARMRELAIADYDSYYQVVCAGIGGRIEWVRLLDRLTIQATRFFRHPPSFALLETYVNEFAKTAEGDSLTRLESGVCQWRGSLFDGHQHRRSAHAAAASADVRPDRYRHQ